MRQFISHGSIKSQILNLTRLNKRPDQNHSIVYQDLKLPKRRCSMSIDVMLSQQEISFREEFRACVEICPVLCLSPG
jgi:hypothetical protein